MKEPLVSIFSSRPHASPLDHNGNNIFIKYNHVPILNKLSPWHIFLRSNPVHANLIHVFTLTDNFSKFHVNQSINEGAIQVTMYWKFNQVPLPKKWSPWQIFLKINPINAFTITDNFPKFCVYWSTNVGAILVTTYYVTWTDGLTGQKHYTHTTLLYGV
jgi:hypothetical protein